ncbi:MAG: glycosyltransferase family 2 protein [Candidatus Omnitrophica bacterium]|nr:glycosyltransferase family 2 protein [Candidatus Omnitrophota bacterium]
MFVRKRKDTLVICPVYNEKNTLRNFYENVRKYYASDVLFIDDGSTDTGRDYLTGIRDSHTFLLRHHLRQGYGAAVLSGFEFALTLNYARIVTIDADLQHHPRHIVRFLRGLYGKEVVLGSRYLRVSGDVRVPRSQAMLNRYVRQLLKMLFALSVSDPFCAYRGYRSSFLKKVTLAEKGYGLSLEIILEILRQEVDFEEIPVEAIYPALPRNFLEKPQDLRRRMEYYLDIIEKKRVMTALKRVPVPQRKK